MFLKSCVLAFHGIATQLKAKDQTVNILVMYMYIHLYIAKNHLSLRFNSRSFLSYLEVSFGGESPTTDGTGEGFLPCVGSLMDLQSTGGGETLAAGVAKVLLRRPARGCGRKHRGGGGRRADKAGGWILVFLMQAMEEAVDLRFAERAYREEGGCRAGRQAGV